MAKMASLCSDPCHLVLREARDDREGTALARDIEAMGDRASQTWPVRALSRAQGNYGSFYSSLQASSFQEELLQLVQISLSRRGDLPQEFALKLFVCSLTVF